jgi:hypothetical protein
MDKFELREADRRELNPMDANELLQRYAAGERDFKAIDLSDIDLRQCK